MAEIVNVAGTVQIKVNTGHADGLVLLGYSVNGAQIEEQEFNENVPGDQRGGDAGPPIDVLHHGQIHMIQLELSKYDPAVMARVAHRVNAATPTGGTIERGSLYIGDTKTMRVLLEATNFTRNYLLAIPRGTFGMNVGSRYTRQRLGFECHENDSSVMWNTTTS